jgi:hypothetical protein
MRTLFGVILVLIGLYAVGISVLKVVVAFGGQVAIDNFSKGLLVGQVILWAAVLLWGLSLLRKRNGRVEK